MIDVNVNKNPTTPPKMFATIELTTIAKIRYKPTIRLEDNLSPMNFSPKIGAVAIIEAQPSTTRGTTKSFKSIFTPNNIPPKSAINIAKGAIRSLPTSPNRPNETAIVSSFSFSILIPSRIA